MLVKWRDLFKDLHSHKVIPTYTYSFLIITYRAIIYKTLVRVIED